MEEGLPAHERAGETTRGLATTDFTDLADAPTVTGVPARRTTPRLEWQIGRTHRVRSRLLRRFKTRPPRWPWVLGATIALLFALLVPSLLAVASAMQDYSDIRSLGQSGLRHLLGAKSDLSSLSSLTSIVSLSGGGAAANAPYTLLVQRQAGTFNSAQINIQPSPKMKKAGVKATSASTAIGANTPFTNGVAPAPRATPTPTPTPAGTAGKGSSSGTSSSSLIPSPAAMQDAQKECQAAQQDFLALRARLGHLGWAISTASGVPPVGSKLATAHDLADIGYDAASLGVLFAGAAIPLLTKLHGASLTGKQQLISQSDIDSLEKAIAQSQPLFDALQSKLSRVDLSGLPVSASELAEFTTVKAELPKLRLALNQAGQWLTALGWMLGTDAPRHFLLQTLDRTELRASGGFAGDFGILSIQNGKLSPFSLAPVSRIDYGGFRWYDGWNAGRRPPNLYSWWPIANWGFRDSNLAADFPATAQLTMMALQGECGTACQAEGVTPNVDGVIQVTPVAIEHVLQVTGNLAIPDYGVTITPDNLEYMLHYYSLQHANGSYPPGPINGALTDRKQFMYEFGSLLEARLRGLSQSQVVSVARILLQDVKSKDIQIYVTNKTVEGLLAKLNMAGTVDPMTGKDGFFVDQTNVSAAKANPCVTVTETDNVTLDDKGGATHHLTVRMDHVIGSCDPWYQEFPTYHAYMRIYAPATAQLQSADGFDQNQQMCAANCSPDPYPGGELVCQPGGYDPGVHTPSIRPMGAEAGVLDRMGGPTQTTTDVPGTTLWGGFVTIPPFCTANLTLSWYVPGVVHWPPSSSSSNQTADAASSPIALRECKTTA
jgi:hypothetical protein